MNCGEQYPNQQSLKRLGRENHFHSDLFNIPSDPNQSNDTPKTPGVSQTAAFIIPVKKNYKNFFRIF
jgi:hypothetical protein